MDGALLSGLAVTAGTAAINQAGFPAISAWPALLLLLFLCAALWRVFKEVPV
ncbi:hypothetical protein G7085_16455 [Tessaracoccus sp. HDW20]|uniref:hypothetical protein n=1 Tax=Tessaracoccus coleopterorum TaxID=2714950 RepID=UPI0018D287D6|nr:hypothetical protein [Tessaracoccus coleopterorum]NHB85650.1 hypothetical protein [Tessaracoccus coleopterorum]